MNSLFAFSWDRAWTSLHAGADGHSLRDALLARYAEPHRKYHTLQHLDECLRLFETVRALPSHPAEVEMALWFHDAIYDVKASDNEQRSADWAHEALLAAGVSEQGANLVRDLVLVTRHTAVPSTPDEQVLVDIDLSILGAGRERFDEYERQIRDEYSFVPGFIFRRKRRAVLQSFLDRPSIYSTPHFHALLEDRARRNLAKAIAAA